MVVCILYKFIAKISLYNHKVAAQAWHWSSTWPMSVLNLLNPSATMEQEPLFRCHNCKHRKTRDEFLLYKKNTKHGMQGEPSTSISKKSLNFENSGELWSTLEYSGVLKVQRFFADEMLLLCRDGVGDMPTQEAKTGWRRYRPDWGSSATWLVDIHWAVHDTALWKNPYWHHLLVYTCFHSRTSWKCRRDVRSNRWVHVGGHWISFHIWLVTTWERISSAYTI